jgi:hypothetical protein
MPGGEGFVLLVRNAAPSYTDVFASLAAPSGDLVSMAGELGTRTPERRLAARLLRLRSEQLAAARSELEPAERLLELERELARAHRSYACERFLAGCESAMSGPFCAVQVESGLESRCLGYASPTPAGIVALRALLRHGFRVVLVADDPYEDVRERCEAYRVHGGLAEHGALAYDGTRQEASCLAGGAAREELEALHATLLFMPGVYVDRGSRVGVRAYRAEGDGGLEPALAAWALDEAGVDGTLEARRLPRCTDFVPAGSRTEPALAEIPRRLGAVGPERLSAEVATLIGHRPGRCWICRVPRLSADARAFQQALAAVFARPVRAAA